MCDVEALIEEVSGHLSIANSIGLDESVARQYRKDVPRLIAALASACATESAQVQHTEDEREVLKHVLQFGAKWSDTKDALGYIPPSVLGMYADAILKRGFRLPVVSAPTKDYGTLLEWARETAGPKSSGIHELADAIDDLLSRLPVVPVPVYEYGEKFPSGDIFPHRSRIAAENSVDDWNVNAIRLREQANVRASYSGSHIVRRTAGVAPGSWELVPVNERKLK